MITNAEIRDQVAGDPFTVNRTVPGIPTGLTVVKAWLTVKRSKDDLDAAALVQAIITTSATAAGQITADGGVGTGDGTATLKFIVTAAQSAILGFRRRYYYDVQLKFSNGDPGTVEIGKLWLEQGVTDATT